MAITGFFNSLGKAEMQESAWPQWQAGVISLHGNPWEKCGHWRLHDGAFVLQGLGNQKHILQGCSSPLFSVDLSLGITLKCIKKSLGRNFQWFRSQVVLVWTGLKSNTCFHLLEEHLKRHQKEHQTHHLISLQYGTKPGQYEIRAGFVCHTFASASANTNSS